MTEGDRPPPEALGDSPPGSHHHGPVASEPSGDVHPGPAFDSQPTAWHTPAGHSTSAPLEQPEERHGSTPPPEGLPAGTPAVQSGVRRSAGLVIGGAALTALLVGGGAGYGGALLAGRTSEQDLAAPSGGAKTSGVSQTPVPSTGGSLSPRPSRAAPSGQSGRNTVEVANAVLPGTVMIQAGSGTGSGFIFDGSGHIMTNHHVIAAADGERLRVVLSNGRRLNAKVLGRSRSYDLAVLQVKPAGLKPLQIGDSDSPQVGEPVLAVGSPLGLPGTVTSGIVSARNRPVVVRSTENADAQIAYIDAIQTDAPINPGNSGGPLIDSGARVIGVNSAILSLGTNRGQVGSIGLGFAIPINQAVEIGQLLIKNGKATYPVIGANVEEARGDQGVVLTSIVGGGPAADAGLREGDLITKIDGKPVNTVEELIVTIRTHRPRETVVLEYERGEAPRQARIVLGSREG
jgi:putative serine protease PepD